MTSNEQSWAAELKRSQHAAAQRGATPIAVQKKQNKDVMNYAKAELLKAMREKNAQLVADTRDKLFKLRAEKTAIVLREIQDLYGYLEPAAVEAEVEQYYRDCMGLERAVAVRP